VDGAAPALALLAAGGLMLVALGNNASRQGSGDAQPLFWAGLIVIYMPIALRLLSASATRAERLVLCVVLGVSLFLVKVLYNPIGPNPYDELATWRQADDFLQSGHLFTFNPLVEGYAGFPGLATLTGAIAQLTGLSLFHAGVIAIGTARFTLMVALFLFFERVTGSTRAAGIGVGLYAANPSFLYFDAEIGHESLALGVAAALLLTALSWTRLDRRRPAGALGHGLVVAMALLALAVTVIHHMTSYAMLAFFLAWAVLDAWPELRRRARPERLLRGPALPALLMAVTAGFWFGFVAGGHTVNELGDVIVGAVESLLRIIFGGSGPKTLFQGSGQANSMAARALAVASIIPVLALIPLGLRRVWWAGDSSALWRTLALVAVFYPLTLGLRLSLAGTETSQRASEFVFVGLAFLAALLIGELRRPGTPLARLSLSGALALIATAVFLGGLIISSLPANRQPGTFLVSAEARSIDAKNLALADFAATNLEPESRVLADRPSATLLGAYGHLNPVFGRIDGVLITRVIFDEEFEPVHRRVIVDDAIDYLVVDRRQSRQLPLIGYYVESFEPRAFTRRTPLSERALDKFNFVPGLSKVFSNGTTSIYETSGLAPR
jgi:hypothetical protein